jgi:hypothetical protein
LWTTSRRTKGGEVVRYLALAHNERNERGVPVAKVIHNLGREDMPDREALVRLVGSIQRFLGGEDGLRVGTPRGFEFLSDPESGGPHVVGALREALGIGRVIARGRRGRGRSGVERAIFTMVCQICLGHTSKLQATRWVGRGVVIEGVQGVTYDRLYRAMDFLLECSERVQESVFFSVALLLSLEGDLLRHHLDLLGNRARRGPRRRRAGRAADHSQADGPLRRQGHSKDHRPDLPQVVIGLRSG